MRRVLRALAPKNEIDQDRLALACVVTVLAFVWFAFPVAAFFIARWTA